MAINHYFWQQQQQEEELQKRQKSSSVVPNSTDGINHELQNLTGRKSRDGTTGNINEQKTNTTARTSSSFNGNDV